MRMAGAEAPKTGFFSPLFAFFKQQFQEKVYAREQRKKAVSYISRLLEAPKNA